VQKNTKFSVVANRLAEVGCLLLPTEVRQKIDEVFTARLALAEVELARELFDKKSVSRIFREVMCPAARSEGAPPLEGTPSLPKPGFDAGGGAA
jgi:hypothetical protein